MMIAVLEKIFLNYMTELLAGSLLFMGALPRRNRFWLRAAVGLVAADLIAYVLDTNLVYPNMIFGSLTFLICFVFLGIPYVVFCCKASWMEAAVCALFGYATQHFASSLHIFLGTLLNDSSSEWYAISGWQSVDYLPAYLVSYLLFYFCFARSVKRIGFQALDTARSLTAFLVILPVVLFLSIVAKYIISEEGDSSLFLLCQVYAMVCCFYMLWTQVGELKIRRLQSEMALKDRLWAAQRERFALSKETIDLINHKCHDLKHQIGAIRRMENPDDREAVLREVEDAVLIYDTDLHTGNEALDTVLAEKSLVCRKHQISLGCVADGTSLAFLNVIDLYTMFGNALDNAIECVSQLPDPEERLISLKVFRQNRFLMIQVENRCEAELTFSDGLPVTTKPDTGYHGFGMKSILYAAEKYDGCITAKVQEGMFHLQILIPLPEGDLQNR